MRTLNANAPRRQPRGAKQENSADAAVFYPQYMTASRKCQYPRRLAARGTRRLALLAVGAGERLARVSLRLECEP